MRFVVAGVATISGVVIIPPAIITDPVVIGPYIMLGLVVIGTVPVLIGVPVVIGIGVVPLVCTISSPVTVGVALEVLPFMGMGAGVVGIVAGTPVAGLTVAAGMVVNAGDEANAGAVFRARMRAKKPIRRCGAIKVLSTLGGGTLLRTGAGAAMGALPTRAGAAVEGSGASGGSAVAVATNTNAMAARDKNRFMLLPPETC